MSRHLSTRNISSKSLHAFLSNLANRQTDKRGQTRCLLLCRRYSTLSTYDLLIRLVGGNAAVGSIYAVGLRACARLYRDLRAIEPSLCLSSHPGKLSLAIPMGRRSEYQRKLGSKQAHHVMHLPRIRNLTM